MNYGLQLYSIGKTAEKDFGEAVKLAADLGYASVESAGFFGKTPAEVRDVLARSNVTLSGTHSPYKDLTERLEETIAFHKAIGNKNYIIPGHTMKNQAAIDEFVQAVARIQPRLRQEGIALSFHNHYREFLPNEDGSVVFEQLLYRTELTFEVDTYWAYIGMQHPIELLDRVGDRLWSIHIRDGMADRSGMPLGRGTAPVSDVWRYAKERGIPMVVECETDVFDEVEGARLCIEYLKNLK